jgi:hypothetical protein
MQFFSFIYIEFTGLNNAVCSMLDIPALTAIPRTSPLVLKIHDRYPHLAALGEYQRKPHHQHHIIPAN